MQYELIIKSWHRCRFYRSWMVTAMLIVFGCIHAKSDAVAKTAFFPLLLRYCKYVRRGCLTVHGHCTTLPDFRRSTRFGVSGACIGIGRNTWPITWVRPFLGVSTKVCCKYWGEGLVECVKKWACARVTLYVEPVMREGKCSAAHLTFSPATL